MLELSSLALFEGCGQDDLDRVAKASIGARKIAQGDVLCRQGDAADRWWVVHEGTADVTVDGLFAATIGRGEAVGEVALLDGGHRGATVTATTDMVVEEIDGEPFIEALAASPQLALSLMRQLARRLRAANDQLTRPHAGGGDAAAPATATTAAAGAGAPAAGAPAARAPAAGAPAATTATKAGSDAALPALDPRAPGYFANPYALLGTLRDAGPIHPTELFGGRLVTRHEDVHRLLRHPATIGSVASGQPAGADTGTEMIRRDGPDHLRLRRLVSQVFTPKAVAQWRAKAEEIVEHHLAEVADRDEIDVIEDFSMWIPTKIISEMLGVPRDDIPRLRDWSRKVVSNMEPIKAPGMEDAIAAAGEAMHTYLTELVAEKRSHPGDDIITGLLNAEEAGDCLDEKEVRDQLILLYVAGHETTVNLIGNGLGVLLLFPAEADRLRADPNLDANAAEEVLRYESPAQYTFRIPTEAITVGDEAVEAGELLVLALASANRDPRKWGPTADALDVGRPHANEHVSFGGGPHYCLGAALARMQGQIAVPRMIRRFPRMALTSDTLDWGPRMMVRGLDTLPVTLR